MGFLVSKFAFLPPDPPTYGPSFHNLRFFESAHWRIPIVHITNRQAAYTVLYMHGNAEDLGILYPYASSLCQYCHMNMVCMDYPGYGLSRPLRPTRVNSGRGRPSEKAVYECAEAALGYIVTALHIPLSRIIVYGRSLGSGPATYLASRHDVAGLILHSPLLSAIRVVVSRPMCLSPCDIFNNKKNIQMVTAPVLVIHGEKDDIVPFSHGVQLHKSSSSKVDPLWCESAGHNDIELINGDALVMRIRKFLREIHNPADPSVTSATSSSNNSSNSSSSSHSVPLQLQSVDEETIVSARRVSVEESTAIIGRSSSSHSS
jgi:pimeloyl-ACP methyl ester carboxylesterase